MKLLLKNKKAQSSMSGEGEDDGSSFVVSSKIFHFIFILILLILAFVLFIFISQNYIDSLAAVPAILERDLIITRITNNCFSPQDPITGYQMQNVIDISLFTKEQYMNCFSDRDAPQISIELKSIYEVPFFSEGEFEKISFKTTSNPFDYWHERYVLAYDEGIFYPAFLFVRLD